MAWARTRAHASRVDRARRYVEEAFHFNESWYVALSGGKDSICVLDLVRKLRPETPAQVSVREWDLPETVEYLGNVPNLRAVAYAAPDAGVEWAKRWTSEQAARATWPDVLWVDRHQEISEHSERGTFLGLRAAEASYRMTHLSALGALYEMRDRGWRCNPIAWWSTLDVWAYILGRGIPYNRAYDIMESIGVPLERQRIGPFACALNSGSLAIIKRGWPEFFNRLASQHPEARCES